MKRPLSTVGHRFFSEQPLVSGELATLTGDESRHMMTVMRARVGDEVILFDGSGRKFPSRISQVSRHTVQLEVLAQHDISRELPGVVVLAVSLPRGERQRWLVEKAVELGVTRLVPLMTTRGVAQPTPEALERLRRAVIEASKQCGRNRLMEIGTPRSVSRLVADESCRALRLLAHPGSGRGIPRDLSWVHATANGSGLVVAVGPEGGFADDEAQQAHEGGWQLVALGPRILRIETAALAMVAALVLSIEDT